MGNAKIIPRGFRAALLLVLLAGAVGGLGQWWADGDGSSLQLSRVGEWLGAAWEAAVVEEVLFRGVLLWACLSWAQRFADPSRFAVAATSLAFGLMHLLPDGPLVAPGADMGIVVAQGFLKITQATLFGAVMARLVVCSPFDSCALPRRALALVAPVIIHGLFDMLFFGPLLLTGNALPSTYLTGNMADFLPLVVTTVLLAWALKSC